MDCTAANHPFFMNRVSSRDTVSVKVTAWADLIGLSLKPSETIEELSCRIINRLTGVNYGLHSS